MYYDVDNDTYGKFKVFEGPANRLKIKTFVLYLDKEAKSKLVSLFSELREQPFISEKIDKDGADGYTVELTVTFKNLYDAATFKEKLKL